MPAAFEYRFSRLKLGQCTQAMFVVGLAVFGQTLAPRGALQQAGAKARLQSRQPLADSGAREVQALGGLGQIAAFDNLQKELNTIKTRSGHARLSP